MRRKAGFWNCDNVPAADRPRPAQPRLPSSHAHSAELRASERSPTRRWASSMPAERRSRHHRHIVLRAPWQNVTLKGAVSDDCNEPDWSRSDGRLEHGTASSIWSTLKLDTPQARIFPAARSSSNLAQRRRDTFWGLANAANRDRDSRCLDERGSPRSTRNPVVLAARIICSPLRRRRPNF